MVQSLLQSATAAHAACIHAFPHERMSQLASCAMFVGREDCARAWVRTTTGSLPSLVVQHAAYLYTKCSYAYLCNCGGA